MITTKYEKSLTFQDIDKATLFALCYQAMKKLQLNILFAGTDTLIATTPKIWNSKGQQIMCRVQANQLFVSSETIDAKVADMDGINERNIQAFILALDEAETNTDVETIQSNKDVIRSLKENTVSSTEHQLYGKDEMSRVMNLPVSNLYITYSVLAVNLFVFILMILDGAGLI